MFKKVLAMTIALVVLLQPALASAVTWNQVVSGLRESGTGKYVSDDGATTAELNGDELTVTGGSVSEVCIMDGDSDMAVKFVFVDVAIEGNDFVIIMENQTADVSLQGSTNVSAETVLVEAHSDSASAALSIGEDASIDAHYMHQFATSGQNSLKNEGTINMSGLVSIHSPEGGSVSLDNSGAIHTGDGVFFDIFGEGTTAEFTNDGTVTGQNLNLSASYGASISGSVGENGVVELGDQMYIASESYHYGEREHGGLTEVSFTNNGLLDMGRNTYIVALGNAKTDFTNKGTMVNEVYSEVGYSEYSDSEEYLEAKDKVPEGVVPVLSIVNQGTIEDYLSVNAWQVGSLEVTNESEIGNLYVDTFDSSETSVSNTGAVYGEFWAGGCGEAIMNVENTGTVDKLGIYAHDDAVTSVDHSGESREVIALSNGTGTLETTGDGTAELELLIIQAGSADEFSAEQIKAIAQKVGYDVSQTLLEVYEEDEESYAFTQYKINDDGSVGVIVYQEVDGEVTVEGAPEEPEEIDWDAVYAQMRAEDEAKRQAGAVGGVTTSIFRNYQAYLGHSCYNMRMYVGGEKVTTMQSLSWLPGGAAAGKNHSFQMYVDLEKTALADIELRVAQDYLDVCQRSGVAQITLTDKNGEAFAQYAVADLIAAREMYGLEADELLCVSADPNAEVVKIDLEGSRLPLEQAE